MILHYAGKYNGDEATLPGREHHPKAVPFKEASSMKKLYPVVHIGSFLLMIMLAIPFYLLGLEHIRDNLLSIIIACFLMFFSLFLHELLHAIWFKKDVYLYNDLAHGVIFIVGVEDMSKSRFILMSLCPNIIFGFIPYVLFLLFPDLVALGFFGLVSVCVGFGDYMNAYNAIRQMPRGAKTYMSGMHSYWYTDGSEF